MIQIQIINKTQSFIQYYHLLINKYINELFYVLINNKEIDHRIMNEYSYQTNLVMIRLIVLNIWIQLMNLTMLYELDQKVYEDFSLLMFLKNKINKYKMLYLVRFPYLFLNLNILYFYIYLTVEIFEILNVIFHLNIGLFKYYITKMDEAVRCKF